MRMDSVSSKTSRPHTSSSHLVSYTLSNLSLDTNLDEEMEDNYQKCPPERSWAASASSCLSTDDQWDAEMEDSYQMCPPHRSRVASAVSCISTEDDIFKSQTCGMSMTSSTHSKPVPEIPGIVQTVQKMEPPGEERKRLVGMAEDPYTAMCDGEYFSTVNELDNKNSGSKEEKIKSDVNLYANQEVILDKAKTLVKEQVAPSGEMCVNQVEVSMPPSEKYINQCMVDNSMNEQLEKCTKSTPCVTFENDLESVVPEDKGEHENVSSDRSRTGCDKAVTDNAGTSQIEHMSTVGMCDSSVDYSQPNEKCNVEKNEHFIPKTVKTKPNDYIIDEDSLQNNIIVSDLTEYQHNLGKMAKHASTSGDVNISEKDFGKKNDTSVQKSQECDGASMNEISSKLSESQNGVNKVSCCKNGAILSQENVVADVDEVIDLSSSPLQMPLSSSVVDKGEYVTAPPPGLSCRLVPCS